MGNFFFFNEINNNIKYHINLIYYDKSINGENKSDETYSYFESLNRKIEGSFFGIYNFNDFKSTILNINKCKNPPDFILICSGSTSEEALTFCHKYSFIKKIIIFCFMKNKYIYLKKKYSKIIDIETEFLNVKNLLKNYNFVLAEDIEGAEYLQPTKLITLKGYQKKYINLHKKFLPFFDTTFSFPTYKSIDKNKFKNFIKKEVNDDFVLNLIDNIENNSSIYKNFIKAYTGENLLCYKLNKWLRDLDNNIYEKIKYFVGPFNYALYKYGKTNTECKNRILYRRLILKNTDLYLYKICEGDIICFPAYTSSSEENIHKYAFPTFFAQEVNALNGDISNEVSVLMLIKCDYKKNDIYPSIDVSELSSNAGEKEFVFPPFSFFKIVKVTFDKGTQDQPHVINLEIVRRKFFIEKALIEGKSFYYDHEKNELLMN